MLKIWLHDFLEVPTTDPDEQRRAKMLNILLLGLVGLLLVVVLITNVGLFFGEYTSANSRLTNISSVVFLASSGVIYLLNRRFSTRLAAVTFLLIMTLGLFFGDNPYESIWGRNMISLAIPIFTTSLLLKPSASFQMAIFISTLSIVMSTILDVSYNIIAVIIYLSLALIAWLTSRSLEQAVIDLRETNLQLDKRVAERTAALDNSVVALQKEIIDRQSAEAALREAHSDLEDRVATRTHDLQMANAQLRQEVLDRKKAEAELEENVRALAASNAELEQFAYVASHDLREPLRKVRSFSELLHLRYQGKLDQKADRYLEFIISGSARMQALIADLLVYSRVGRQALELAEVDLNKLVQVISSDLSMLVAESQATIHCEPLPTIVADRSKILQLLQNLLTNSLKFRRDDQAPQIYVSSEETDDHFVIRVKDNGIGIDQEFSERIFLIFQRLHTKDKYPGTGIGLAICKKIVQDHGGNIWFDSQPGSGTTFVFTLPKQPAKAIEPAAQLETVQ